MRAPCQDLGAKLPENPIQGNTKADRVPARPGCCPAPRCFYFFLPLGYSIGARISVQSVFKT
jgi:hypothetical protein